MSTIKDHPVTERRISAHQPVTPSNPGPGQSALTPEALTSLLRAGPNDAREPKRPEESRPAAPIVAQNPPAAINPKQAKLEQGLKDLSSRLTPQAVDQVLSHPDAQASEELRNQFDELLTKDNINALLSGPNTQENANRLTTIGTSLNKGKIDSIVESTTTQQVDAYRRAINAALFDLKLKLVTSDADKGYDLIHQFAYKEQRPLSSIRHQLNQMQTTQTGFTDTRALLDKDRIDARLRARDVASSPQSTQQANASIYRYNRLDESSLDDPSEVRHFVHDRDKLDVSGIRQQLNTPLRSINQLPRAPGEMQIQHSPATQTSVIAIAGRPGEPPFVVKVFGQVRESDLLT